MSEISISREEAIKDLNALIKIANKDLSTDEIIRNSCTKAISDMEKLDKIEQIVNDFDKGEGHILTMHGAYNNIERIVKG